MVLPLMFLLMSSVHEASQTVPNSNRTEPRRNHLNLPMFLDSELPLVWRDVFSPSSGSGPQAVPQRVRQLLLPAGPGARGPHSPPGAAVRSSCEGKKMQLRVDRRLVESADPGSHLSLGSCRVSRSTEDHLHFEYDLRMCGTTSRIINNRMVYFNTLRYDPPEPRGPIRRAAPFSVPVKCYFNRFVYSYKVGYTPKVQLRKVLKKMKNAAKFLLSPRNETEVIVSSTSWTIDAKTKSKPQNKEVLAEMTAGRSEGTLQPEHVDGVRMWEEEEGEGRWVKGSSVVEGEEKLSDDEAIF